MIPRNQRPPTAGNGEGPENATTGNRCNQNSSTTVSLERGESVSARDEVGEGGTTTNAYVVAEPVNEDAGGHRSQNELSALRSGASVRLDLLSDEPFTVADFGKTHIWLRHAHGWILQVPKWRVTVG